MFQQMRRNRQALSQEEIAAVLHAGTSGVLALSGDDGYPYAVPLSYVYESGKFFFHCAKAGHKIDAIRQSPKASFCVIGQDRIVPEEYTTYFKSVIAFGTIRILEDAAEKRQAIERLAAKYAPKDTPSGRARTIDRAWDRLCILELSVEHLSGKQALELAEQK